MKRLTAMLLALMLLVTLGLACAEEAAEPLLVRADFTCDTADGGVFTLSEHLGEVVFINFWATWCRPCCYELPALDELAARYADAEDVTVMTVNCGERMETVKAFLAEGGYGFPVACDTTGRVAMMYGADTIPATLIYDKTGAVYGAWVGVIADVSEICQRYADIIEALR